MSPLEFTDDQLLQLVTNPSQQGIIPFLQSLEVMSVPDVQAHLAKLFALAADITASTQCALLQVHDWMDKHMALM